ncbi:MAG: aminotransferase [Thermovirga sp.]|nr:aminotransferase [Thermovirga sp.]
MKIKPFGVEEWMNKYEMEAVYNIAETCVDSLTVNELLELSGKKEEVLEEITKMRVTYGNIHGHPHLRELIATLYSSVKPENVLTTTGGISANFLALFTIVEPGDKVISVAPTYQQLYSLPEALGAEVSLLQLRPENNFLPNLEELKELSKDGVDLIILNNPNNPTGALMDKGFLEKIAEIARQKGAWVLCDEAYRGLEHKEEDKTPSMVDVYEKAVATGSMSKVFSLAGLRLGWLTGPSEFIRECALRRDYTTISCGQIDEALALVALENKDKILARNLSIVRESVEIVDNWVKSEERISWVKPKAGTTGFLHYDYAKPSEEFCIELFRTNGTFLVPGKCFDRENWLRIGYAYGKETLRKGLKGLSSYLRKLEKEGVGRVS